MELPISKPQPKELRLAKDERRQSIEEFIEMGLSNPTSPTKVYIEALDQIPLPPVELGTRDSKKIVIKVKEEESEYLFCLIYLCTTRNKYLLMNNGTFF